MADYDFEVLNAMAVVRDQPTAEDPVEIQLDISVPSGAEHGGGEPGGQNIRAVPLLVRTVP